MTAPQIEIRGLDKLLRKYRRLGKNASPAIRDLTKHAADYAHSQVPSYPPPRPESRYRRTGTLGRTIHAKVKNLSDTEWAGILGTPTAYAPWVISSERTPQGVGGQAWFHKERWWTLQGVVKGARNAIVKIYQDGIRRLLQEADRGT